MANDKDFALVIGVNDYKQLPCLNGPTNDATKFRDWLLKSDGGNMPDGNCKFILSQANPLVPIQQQIDDELEDIVSRNDGSLRRFYFYFAGHGMGITWDVNGLCLPRWSDIQRNNALSSKGYLDYLIGSAIFQEVYFFLDCCRSHSVGVVPQEPNLNNIRTRGAGVSSVAMYATPFENTAGEGPQNGANSLIRGYFSQALDEGLNGNAADGNGTITASTLIDFAKRRTDEIAKADGRGGQTINTQLNFGGKGPNDLIIRQGVAPVLTNLVVTFAHAGSITLSGFDLRPIKQAQVIENDIWPAIQLTNGLYKIQNLTTRQSAIIEINGSQKDIDYAF